MAIKPATSGDLRAGPRPLPLSCDFLVTVSVLCCYSARGGAQEGVESHALLEDRSFAAQWNTAVVFPRLLLSSSHLLIHLFTVQPEVTPHPSSPPRQTADIQEIPNQSLSSKYSRQKLKVALKASGCALITSAHGGSASSTASPLLLSSSSRCLSRLTSSALRLACSSASRAKLAFFCRRV